MTKKEIKEYKKELLSSLIEECIGGNISKLNNKNKKLLKDMLTNDINTTIFTITYIRSQYFGWEVDIKDYELNSNFERLVYLFNQNYEVCCNMIEPDYHTTNIYENDYDFNVSYKGDIKSYKDIAEEVGL